MNKSNIGKKMSVAEYNSNNAWFYNGNNGRLNNNNKYNSYSVRSLLDSYPNTSKNLLDYLIPLHEWYAVVAICRRRKCGKPSWLLFDARRTQFTAQICHEIGNMEYMPKEAICFIITKPRIREVIAADFSDRLVQTWYVETLKYALEKEHLHKDSYSCRIGKGGLNAVLTLRDYIRKESNGYMEDVWIAARDIQSFFMSIVTDLSVSKMEAFITSHFSGSRYYDLLIYLTRIIFQSLPQEGCYVKSPKWMWDELPKSKSLLGTDGSRGIPIGNVTSQTMANFLTTFYLNYIESLGYTFIHYTDDTTIIIKDLRKWREDEPMLEVFLERELGLTMHPKKRYLQHYSKGVQTLGFKVRFDRILPSDRIYHNFTWKVECAIRKADKNPRYAEQHAEEFMQVVNSYMGLLKWCNSYKLRKRIMTSIKASAWGKVYDFDKTNSKVTIKKSKQKIVKFKQENRKRRREMVNALLVA